MKFLVDNQLPSALAHYLVSRGFECQHVLDIGLGDAADAAIWEYACEAGFTVISKDEDFLRLASTAPTNGSLVWIRVGNCRKNVLLAVIETTWPKIEAALKAGERIIEVR